MSIKKKITQYIDLQKEYAELKEKISKLQKQIEKIETDGTVLDKVKGGEGGWQSFKIEGFPYPEYSRKKTLMYERMATLSILELELMESLNNVEICIANIDDSHIRRIVNLRVVEGLSWNRVADRIGGNNTEDSVKKSFYRYLDKESCPICPEKI